MAKTITHKGKEYERTGTYFKTPTGISALIYKDSEGEEYILYKGKMTNIKEFIKKEEEPEEQKVEIVEVKKEQEKGGMVAAKAKEEAEIIKKASEYASVLSDVIEKQKLYVKIKNRKYVRIEGWQVLGALLKCKAVIKEVKELNEGWEATAEIYNQRGEILSRATARCLKKEPNWRDRDDYAILSMAQTRAVAKAYRLGFAWILALAGYEPTPAEEVE